jgi:MFS family permease
MFYFVLESNISEKYYIESLASVSSVIGRNIELNVQQKIKFDDLKVLFLNSRLLLLNSLNRVLDLSNLHNIDINANFVNISLLHKNANILLSLDNDGVYKSLIKNLLKNLNIAEPYRDNIQLLTRSDAYHFFYNFDQNTHGLNYYVAISIDKHIFKESFRYERQKLLFNLLVYFAITSFMFILISDFYIKKPSNESIDQGFKKRIIILAILIASSHSILLISNLYKFKNIYRSSMAINLYNLDELLDIHPLSKLASTGNSKCNSKDRLLKKISSIMSDCIYVENYSENDNIYSRMFSENSHFEFYSLSLRENILLNLEIPIIGPNNLYIEFSDYNGAMKKLRFHLPKITSSFSFINLLVNSSIKSLTSLLFFIELLIFYKLATNKKNSKMELFEKNENNLNFRYIRTAAFIFLFGIDLSISFVPLHAKELCTPDFSLAEKTLIGIPITMEFIFVGISILAAGVWCDRRGWHEPFLVGCILSSVASLFCWICNNFLIFVGLRAIVGFGYGLMLLSSQAYIIKNSSMKNRTFAIAQFISGIYAGSICGAASGAILSDAFGYSNVFLVAGLIISLLVPYYMLFLKEPNLNLLDSFNFSRRSYETKKGIRNDINLKKRQPGVTTFSFLKNKLVISLILFSSLPTAVATVGFLNYFSPIYLQEIGISQSIIGSVFIVYGISLVYLGPILSKFADRTHRKRNFIFLGCILASITFMLFYFIQGIAIVLLAAFLLGLSTSLIIASQSAYLLNLEITKRFGEGKALGIFRGSSRAGQAIGPIIFSCIYFGENINKNIALMGLLYLLTSIIFIALTYKDGLSRKDLRNV